MSDREKPLLDSPLIVALDYGSAEEALRLARQLDPGMVRLKVGKELFTAAGPSIVLALQDLGFEIFLDLKFHDIPNTVGRAVAAAAELGVWMVNVHASGGSRMMSAARDALSSFTKRPYLIAVTVLTSMQRDDLAELGWDAEPIDRVRELAALAEKVGLDGVVCSAAEAALLSQHQRPGFLLVTPGIRQAGDDAGDQRRVFTPSGAMEAGATHLVVGRSITQAHNPATTATQIVESLNINASR